MFLGTFEILLTDNNRLSLPKKIRQELGSQNLVITIGFDKCVFGFAEKSWDDKTKLELERPLFSDLDGRNLRRKMFSQAEKINLDAQGRFVLADTMVSYAEIEKNIVIIGAGDHFEIWSKEKWEEYRVRIEK